MTMAKVGSLTFTAEAPFLEASLRQLVQALNEAEKEAVAAGYPDDLIEDAIAELVTKHLIVRCEEGE